MLSPRLARLTEHAPDLLVLGMLLVVLQQGLHAVSGLSWPCDVDLYRDIGFAQSMADGQLLADPLYRGEKLWYNPLVPGVIALGATLLGLPVHLAATQLGAILNLLAPIGFYLLVARLFDRKVGAAATLAFLFFNPGDFPSWTSATYSPWLFPGNFVQSLFYLGLLWLHRALSDGRWRSWLLSGLLLGLCFLGHTAPALLLGMLVLLGSAFGLRAAARRDGARSGIRGMGRPLLLFLVAVVVSLPYTWVLLVHYGASVQNHEPSSWIYPRLDLRALPELVASLFAPATGLALLGYVQVLVGRLRPRVRPLLLGWLGIAGALFAYSYVRQWYKINGTDIPEIVPGYHFFFYLRALQSLFIGIALAQAGRLLAWIAASGAARLRPSLRTGAKDPMRELVALTGVLVLAFGLGYPLFLDREDWTSERHKAQRLTPTVDQERLFYWIRGNTDPDEVFLASDHLSLHLLSPAGRKVVAMIPFFSNPFVPWQQRHEDRAALFTALFMGDREQFAPLQARYGVRYVLEEGAQAVKLFGSSMTFLELAYRSGPLWLFRVQLKPDAPAWWLPPEDWEPPGHRGEPESPEPEPLPPPPPDPPPRPVP